MDSGLKPDEKQALRAVLKRKPFARLTISDSTGACYRYQYDPFAPLGSALRAPLAGTVFWQAEPGPVEAGETLAEIAQGEQRSLLQAPAAGCLGRPLLAEGTFAHFGAALAIMYEQGGVEDVKAGKAEKRGAA